MDGSTYVDPADRLQFLASVRDGQKKRHMERYELLKDLGSLTALTITADKITAVQQSFTAITERELQVYKY